MNSYNQKSVEESLELEIRALLNNDYFDRLSFNDKVDIIVSLFKCFDQYVSK